jgi:hypothetical protein
MLGLLKSQPRSQGIPLAEILQLVGIKNFAAQDDKIFAILCAI